MRKQINIPIRLNIKITQQQSNQQTLTLSEQFPDIPALESLNSDHKLVGNKALNLCRLIQHGFAVPPGYVIPANITQQLTGDLTTWPESIKQQIDRLYHLLCAGGKGVAVRSSSLREDSNQYSFAGQYLTVLNIYDEQTLFTAIKEVIDSFHSKTVDAYQAQTKQTTESSIAVIIQHMLDGELAGVVFTANPINQKQDQIIVEAVAGLGESLVSGHIEADRFIFDKQTLTIIEEYHPQASVLMLSVAQKIATEAIKVENVFAGEAQDIEYSYYDKRIWLLQSRPITTLNGKAEECYVNEFDTSTTTDEVWTCHNAQEVLPNVLPPLTISYLDDIFVNAYLESMYFLFGKSREFSSTGFFYNRLHLNLSHMVKAGYRMLGSNPEALASVVRAPLPANIKPPLFFIQLYFTLKSIIPFIYHIFINLEKNINKHEAELFHYEQSLKTMDFSQCSDIALWQVWRIMRDQFYINMVDDFRASTAITIHLSMLKPFLKAVYSNEEADYVLNILNSGLSDVESAKISEMLWELSKIALQEKLSLTENFDPTVITLPASWHEAFNRFIKDYGHRCEDEWDLRSVPWRTNTKPVISMINHYMKIDESSSPSQHMKAAEKNRQQLTEEILLTLKPTKRKRFLSMLKNMRKGILQRERTKSISVRATHLIDYIQPEMTKRLLQHGFIQIADDFFFLTVAELEAIFNGRPESAYQEKIIRRRKEMERNRFIVLPEHFTGQPKPLQKHIIDSDQQVFRGIPVNPGVVTGNARVILNLNEADTMRPGEILVVHNTDVAWTPLFSLASAVVVDIGNILSHGSIVAREFGIPGVMSVKNGTECIHTGDLIIVDGKQGTVTILQKKKRIENNPLA
jgi:phosphohistidine swiveling domain-containing protein